MVVSATE